MLGSAPAMLARKEPQHEPVSYCSSHKCSEGWKAYALYEHGQLGVAPGA
jgi:hypothetical protein